ncbi:hypothetical protein [Staphylococcus gallinarum]|uniref:hypothetical protein n=1 Tax=Staphylococcus gallinarum TaxID=1293 RepID=UPI001E4A8E94|nr:hypothetical protein [Staphylococcus gallinarum]MCD8921411.1 hypothetical protein [Staphylococcus gallinarum]MEB6278764.1 hypothetical protein [Staphylococcus gallinarum]UEG99556.1 hypothetical protein K3U27_07435 [Staphylococcus gallinarum]
MNKTFYTIEYDSEYKLATFHKYSKSGHDFSYVFSGEQTIETIIFKMKSITQHLNLNKGK